MLLGKLRESGIASSSSASSSSSPSPSALATKAVSASPAAKAVTPSFAGPAKPGEATTNYSTGNMSRSLTSTSVNVATTADRIMRSEDELMYGKIKKKGYARIVTNRGTLNVELFADQVLFFPFIRRAFVCIYSSPLTRHMNRRQ